MTTLIDDARSVTKTAVAGGVAGAGLALGVHFRDSVPMGVAEGAVVLALLAGVWGGGIRKPDTAWPMVALAVFPLAAALSLVLGGTVGGESMRYLAMIAFASASAIGGQFVQGRSVVVAAKTFVLISAAVALVSAIGLVLFLNGNSLLGFTAHGAISYARSEGFIEGPNYFAISLLFAFFVAFALYRLEKWGLVPAALILIGMVAAGSRGVLVALAVFFAVLFVGGRTSWRQFSRIMALTAIGGVLLYILVPVETAQTMVENRVFDRTGGGSARIEMLWPSIEIFLQGNWLFGAGRAVYEGAAGAPHNSYLTVLVDYGLVGLAGFFATVFLSIWYCGRHMPHFALPLALAISLAIAALFNDYQFVREWWFSLGLACALASNASLLNQTIR